MVTTVQDIKTLLLLPADNTKRDSVIAKLLSNVEKQLKALIKNETIPDDLSFVVEEITVIRFRRLGSEGMNTESVEGHSVTYNLDDFKPYAQILVDHIPKSDDWIPGEVLLY